MKPAQLLTLLSFCTVAIAPTPAKAASCFAPPAVYRLQSDRSPLGSGAVGDFNNDGNLDFAVPFDGACSGGRGAYIFLGDGKGGFKPTLLTEPNGSRFGLVAGDFNGDGKLDLAGTYSNQCRGNRQLEVALGNGDGTFQPRQLYNDGLVSPKNLATADFNGDGHLDLLVPDQGMNFMFLGNSDGTFQPALQSPNGVGNDIVAADLNHDGKMDTISAVNGIQIKLGNGDGTFGLAFTYPGGPHQAVGDLNKDGNLDVVNLLKRPTEIATFLGNGDGTVTRLADYSSYANGNALIADFSGDGNPDVVVTNNQGPAGDFTVLLGLGDGTLSPRETIHVPTATLAIAAADFNHDRLPDLVIQTFFASITRVGVYLNSGQCH